MTVGQDIPASSEQHPTPQRYEDAAGRVPRTTTQERASTIRLCVSASIGTVLTVIFLAWLWGTIAPQPPGPLENVAREPATTAQHAIEEQAQRLSGT
ncbi:hypothetical protein GFH48_38370 [Streptomyces fagopyri]|uniref:Uncharacterized protein n=1 Tax=Streptomyces fagopyri TaxID=2662397 RepID=A0A5Q0LPE0_9ACTN|nr:hypothetical protein [Streptomyces fagopyri]QFZ78379.1 hypothetical protein GFH48_38370 [Streptomyces fagopyri]